MRKSFWRSFALLISPCFLYIYCRAYFASYNGLEIYRLEVLKIWSSDWWRRCSWAALAPGHVSAALSLWLLRGSTCILIAKFWLLRVVSICSRCTLRAYTGVARALQMCRITQRQTSLELLRLCNTVKFALFVRGSIAYKSLIISIAGQRCV